MAGTILVQGFDGDVDLGAGWSLKSQSWSISINQNTKDVTGFDDSGWSAMIYGCKSWTATVNGIAYADSGEAPLNLTDGLEADIVLTASEGNLYSGHALVTSQTANRSVCNEMPVTISFVGDGELTQTWAGATP